MKERERANKVKQYVREREQKKKGCVREREREKQRQRETEKREIIKFQVTDFFLEISKGL